MIIFDEVQLYPRARAAIKYIVEDGRYDYIETGLLVSIKKNVENIMIPSEEEEILMYPMDFEEFLWAIGNDTMMPLICHNFEKLHEVGQSMHRKCMDLFRQYLTVGGGMPQAVAKYGNFLATPYVLHTADLVIDDGITYLPLYMTGLL